jgi:hypothetical protein
MTLSYFDSSSPLAIILDEDRKQEAYEYWHNNEEIEREIFLRKELSYCRALDAIHERPR